jgi:phosphatidylserine/phosphatidylglycerophosphate/cardiolipin synthase-like enzyme
MIDNAKQHIELSHFYASTSPDGARPGRLAPIIDALARAQRRGVRVRMLLDASFAGKYPDAVAQLGEQLALRLFDVSASMGGVQHAKYMLVDGHEVYLGSANFDWRALEHIHEMGIRIHHPQVAAGLADVFELDWALAGGEPKPVAKGHAFPAHVGQPPQRITPIFSPKGWLPQGARWDLPALTGAIDAAKKNISLQLLSFKRMHRDGRPFNAIQDALARAAERGVKIDIILSHWVTGPGAADALGAIARTPGIALKIATIPPDPEGFIPFARVVHAKYLLIDGATTWIGSSNFSGDYFFRSRNVGVVVEGKAIAGKLHRVFQRLWRGPYVETFDPARHASRPRIAR